MKAKQIFLLPLLILCLLLAGCATIYNPATGKEEWIMIDTEGEVALGRRVAGQIESEYSVLYDPQLTDWVQNTGQQVAAVSDRKDLTYHFKILDIEQINAFTTPGGYIYVNRGLAEAVENNDELACVLAHEIGHVAARHIVKRLQTIMGYQILSGLVFGAAGVNAAEFQRAANLTFQMVVSGYSREDELFADRLAVRYAMRAGFNPEGMISVLEGLEKISDRDKTALGTVFSDHPPFKTRIEAVKDEIARQKMDVEIKKAD